MSDEVVVCQHQNLYQDDLRGEWHCDDCGRGFGMEKPSFTSMSLEQEKAKEALALNKELPQLRALFSAAESGIDNLDDPAEGWKGYEALERIVRAKEKRLDELTGGKQG